MLNKIKIFNIDITNETSDKILEYILQRLKLPEKFYIVTPNPEIMVYASKHEKYKKMLDNAEIALPDGVGLFLASIFMAKPFKQRIPGIDFMGEICKSSVRNAMSIGLLGGREGVAQRTAECLLKKYPSLRIVYVAEEWSEEGFHAAEQLDAGGRWQVAGGEKHNQEEPRATRHAPQAIDLLFVAFGHPKQEEWISENLKNLPVKAAMGVGGAFDYITGDVTRAPFLVRAIGFEWLYRLIHQPWRWRRQLALFEFMRLIVQERFQKPN